jgi:methylated-DNA-[protein]-cysteine S-methyltransferase
LGVPQGYRAVGSAVGRNPISILVPCHRVVGQDGSLTGYAGGLHRKQALLALEGVAAVANSASIMAATIAKTTAGTHTGQAALAI